MLSSNFIGNNLKISLRQWLLKFKQSRRRYAVWFRFSVLPCVPLKGDLVLFRELNKKPIDIYAISRVCWKKVAEEKSVSRNHWQIKPSSFSSCQSKETFSGSYIEGFASRWGSDWDTGYFFENSADPPTQSRWEWVRFESLNKNFFITKARLHAVSKIDWYIGWDYFFMGRAMFLQLTIERKMYNG